MRALTFWKEIIVDRENALEGLVNLLEENSIRYCVIGGQAVNAYAEPLVSLDLDLVVAIDQLDQVESLLSGPYKIKRFPHSLKEFLPDSDLRIQIQTDRRYASFPERAIQGNILGMSLPVATLRDVLRGKVWAALDPDRRASKRQKDLADIARLLEAYPELRAQTPEEVLRRLI